jgi:undecaprenyl pyrophosphate phosphatase UppP
MIIEVSIIMGTLTAIVGFFIRRYLNNQDKKYEILVSDSRNRDDKLIKVIGELKNAISGLRTNTATQKTLFLEKHKAIEINFDRLNDEIKCIRDVQRKQQEHIQLIDKQIHLTIKQ